MKAIASSILTLSLILSVNTIKAENQNKKFNDWEAGSIVFGEVPITFANTTNDSESTLGVICVEKLDNCLPYLINKLSCVKEGRYPALVYVDDGLEAVSMECLQIEDRYLFILPKNHLQYIITKNKYAVAFGVDGKFKAAYFSLSGSAKALISAKSMLGSMSKPTDKRTSEKPKYKDTML